MKRFRLVYCVVLFCILFEITAQVRWSYGQSIEIEDLSQGLLDESSVIKNYSLKELVNIFSSKEEVMISDVSKRIIENEFLKSINKETILLAGIAGVESALNEIRYLASLDLEEPSAGRFYGTNEWAANLVMARKGVRASIDKIINFAKNQDFHAQVVFVMHDFQLVPQPEIVSYMIEFLESDERLDPVKPTVLGIPVTNYAAASLARILRDFPVEFREDYSYTEEEIVICREWVSGQKQWEFK